MSVLPPECVLHAGAWVTTATESLDPLETVSSTHPVEVLPTACVRPLSTQATEGIAAQLVQLEPCTPGEAEPLASLLGLAVENFANMAPKVKRIMTQPIVSVGDGGCSPVGQRGLIAQAGSTGATSCPIQRPVLLRLPSAPTSRT